MKYIATAALMLNLGVAGLYAHEKPVNMTYSGTGGASAIDLGVQGAANVEENFAGNGTLGAFTFRAITAEMPSPSPSSTCPGPNQMYSIRMAGGGIFSFRDGSQLMLNGAQGTDCIDFAKLQAHCTVTFQISGGTGRFKNATGQLTYATTVLPVVFTATGPVFFAETDGVFTGTISGVAKGAGEQDEP